METSLFKPITAESFGTTCNSSIKKLLESEDEDLWGYHDAIRFASLVEAEYLDSRAYFGKLVRLFAQKVIIALQPLDQSYVGSEYHA